ncbi:ABC transporter permease [Natronomonas marina]|jgi:peptide/nickel transport system permease protein|uniref:ABC transporter permease n=1 Tax=Natronomonas marina TaxID=2961939 RepID=UPI0020CA2547|nr:ABC transporter permease [Natronomonas marina]
MLSDRVRKSLAREFRTSRLAQVGAILMLVILLSATFAPFLTLHNPTVTNIGTGDSEDISGLPPLGVTYTTQDISPGGTETVVVEPRAEYPLGTNTLGQDIYSRLLYGARVSVLVGVLGALLATLIGVPYGLAAGYLGGRVDDSLMRGADIMLAFPSLVLAIALVGVFRDTDFHTVSVPDPFVAAARSEVVPNAIIPRSAHVAEMPAEFTFPVTVTIVVALVNWVWFARVARGEAISVRSEEYIKAARSVGASDWRIMRQHVLPNSLTPIIVLATIQVAAIILLESALSFLGFSGTDLTWGADIADGRSDQSTRWWIATMPGLAIVLAVIAVNLLGDWLRDALDPSIEGEGGV